MKTSDTSTPAPAYNPNISNENMSEMIQAMGQRLLSAMERTIQALENNNRGNDNKCKNTSTDVEDKEETKEVVIDPLESETAVSDIIKTVTDLYPDETVPDGDAKSENGMDD